MIGVVQNRRLFKWITNEFSMEMNYTTDRELMEEQLAELGKGFHSRDKNYKNLRAQLDRIGRSSLEITKTTYWCWSCDLGSLREELIFYSTPPVIKAPSSDRALMIGTNKEINTYIDSLSTPANEDKTTYCGRTGKFWTSFFGYKNFFR